VNKVILMGRLTRDPEIKYTQSSEPVAVVRFTLAVGRRFKRDGESDVDFINCVAFGKSGEFVSRYFKKGLMVGVVGRINTGSYERDGVKHYTTDIVVEEQYFAESKTSFEAHMSSSTQQSNVQAPAQDSQPEGFYSIDNDIEDDDLPF